MKVIHTTAPIKIEDLKLYFQDKELTFLIDYKGSTIKAEKLLLYISNLDIPCDIRISGREEILEIMTAYLAGSFLVNVPSLEKLAISLLLQHKGLEEVVDQPLLDTLSPYLVDWTQKLESLPLFNMYSINDDELKNWVINNHEVDDTSDLKGINFVSLLKYEDFYYFYQQISSTPKYYSALFNEYIFKGKNLYAYWANENNPMFLLTHAIASGTLDTEEYVNCAKNSSNTKEIF